MLVGYARTSTIEQNAGLEGQERQLREAGCERVYAEQVSSVAEARPQLSAALDFIREGDVLMVAKPDRLARNTAELLTIVEGLAKRKIGLVILSMGGGSKSPLDTRDPTQVMMLTMLAAIAEFERSLMLERQREGIAKAKADKKYKGRKPTARNQTEDVVRLKAAGITPTEIAKQLGMSRMSVYRCLGTTVAT